MRKCALLALCCALASLSACVCAIPFTRVGRPVARPALPRYKCLATSEPIEIDGRLDERAWSKAQAVALTLYDASGPPRFHTELRACWDQRNLYLAFVCLDDDIWATFTKRDSPLWEEKVVEAFIATTADISRYYEFEASPLNTVLDLAVSNPQLTVKKIEADFSWTCQGWKTAVAVKGKVNDPALKDERWTSEWAIPFASIAPGGKPPRPGTVWRVNFYRIDHRRGGEIECSAWSPTLTREPDFHVPPRFGYLEFSPAKR
jgi:hypothetical protein